MFQMYSDSWHEAKFKWKNMGLAAVARAALLALGGQVSPDKETTALAQAVNHRGAAVCNSATVIDVCRSGKQGSLCCQSHPPRILLLPCLSFPMERTCLNTFLLQMG